MLLLASVFQVAVESWWRCGLYVLLMIFLSIVALQCSRPIMVLCVPRVKCAASSATQTFRGVHRGLMFISWAVGFAAGAFCATVSLVRMLLPSRPRRPVLRKVLLLASVLPSAAQRRPWCLFVVLALLLGGHQLQQARLPDLVRFLGHALRCLPRITRRGLHCLLCGAVFLETLLRLLSHGSRVVELLWLLAQMALALALARVIFRHGSPSWTCMLHHMDKGMIWLQLFLADTIERMRQRYELRKHHEAHVAGSEQFQWRGQMSWLSPPLPVTDFLFRAGSSEPYVANAAVIPSSIVENIAWPIPLSIVKSSLSRFAEGCTTVRQAASSGFKAAAAVDRGTPAESILQSGFKEQMVPRSTNSAPNSPCPHVDGSQTTGPCPHMSGHQATGTTMPSTLPHCLAPAMSTSREEVTQTRAASPRRQPGRRRKW